MNYEELNENNFKEFLAKKYAVENNPKLDKLYDYAWQEGHAESLEKVELIFSDLVDLIK